MKTLTANSLQILTVFDTEEAPNRFVYSGLVRNALERILPFDLFDIKEGTRPLGAFHALIPLVKWQEWEDHFSVSLLCLHRVNAIKFFLDMISRWLLPGRKINVAFFFAADFQLPEIHDGLYTFSEIVIGPFQEEEKEMVRRNLSISEMEIRLGIRSAYHASRILEIKGLSADEKTSLIQETVASLVHRRPQDFDYDVFAQMQHFLVMCREEFKAARESQHMSRLIYVFYLFRKELRRRVEAEPYKRHLSLKLSRARVHFPFGIRTVLGVFVGMNFLKENEVFEELHLVRGLSRYIPQVVVVEDSFFVDKSREDGIQIIYLEVEKSGHQEFSLNEIKELREKLPEELKASVQQLIRPIFMPRNEEEVMRNIVTLSQQIKYAKDIPQVIISFDQQTGIDLSFTVIVVRVLNSEAISILQLFDRAKTPLKFVLDRVKKVGMIRKKYVKEASVFSIKLSNQGFLREDHSVDLYKARQKVLSELQQILGEVRDFNGGMISKQIEVFHALRHHLGEDAQRNEFLLENFFHAIFPVERRSLVSPLLLKTFFLTLLEIEEDPSKQRVSREEGGLLFVVAKIQDISSKEKIAEFFEALPQKQLSLHLSLADSLYLGSICERLSLI